MSAVFIAPIVEGKGEVEAVPKLLHRLHRQSLRQGVLLVNPAMQSELLQHRLVERVPVVEVVEIDRAGVDRAVVG